jgi:L-alanine-DL-glutamate epimerase-like enolase superfamily enzyme
MQSYPIAGVFNISRGAKTAADVIMVTISDGSNSGRGECVPYKRYGETPESVQEEIRLAEATISSGANRHDLLTVMRPGAARNAIDCALWDLEAKAGGYMVSSRICQKPPAPLTTAYTLSLGQPDDMARQAATYAQRAVLKIKLGTENDEDRLRAVRNAAPSSTLIVDANEGWTPANLDRHLKLAEECRVALIEQPLPAADDEALRSARKSVPICADESVHVTADLAGLIGKYDAVNIKLDKSGGLTEALRMRAEARSLGFQIMVGCMVGSSLAMAPAVLLAQDAEFVDLDGPLLLAKDCEPGLVYQASLVFPPEPSLWG